MHPDPPALALLEFDSIAVGYVAADAMAKRAQVARLEIGTVQPGRLLVLLAGSVAEVEECVVVGRALGASALVDQVYLPGVHPQVVAALAGERVTQLGDALGIVECASAASAVHAADAGLKGADVTLMELRLSNGLGGKGICFLTGSVSAIEIAVELASAVVSPGQLIQTTVISQLSPELVVSLIQGTSWQP